MRKEKCFVCAASTGLKQIINRVWIKWVKIKMIIKNHSGSNYDKTD